MDSILKTYMDDQHTEEIAHVVMGNFERITNRKLTKDEQEFTLMVAKSTLDKYIVENKENIYVVEEEDQEKLSVLLDTFTDSLSTLIVHYIYSRLEAYILYKRLKTLQGEDE